MRTKYKALLFFCLTFCLFGDIYAQAETKEFVREYAYQASEADSKLSSRRNATEEVKRQLLEELGTYIESESIVTNFQLTKDQVVAITGGIVKIEIVMENWDGQKYWLKASLKTDPNDLAKNIDRIRKDRELTRELELVKKRADEANKENNRLRQELEIAKKDKTNSARYDQMIDQSQDRQSEGEKYLIEAKKYAKLAGKEKEAEYYKNKAIEFLGFTQVNVELPEFVIHFPGDYIFELSAGEQSPYWITFAENKDSRCEFYSKSGSDFERVYKDGRVFGKMDEAPREEKIKFKIRAKNYSYIKLEVR